MDEAGWQCDPAVWTKKWGINIQAFGDGANAIKYLAPYVSRSVMGDGRIVSITDTHVMLTRRLRPPARGYAPAFQAVCLASVPRLGSAGRTVPTAMPSASAHSQAWIT
jgi:F0F1-type ATP synthase alpha subunit